jgi:O-antigen/teichoic acid export membrane protein
MKFKISNIYVSTLLSQILSLFLSVLGLKLAASLFDTSDFGLYNVIRRYISILNYPLLMGLGISIPIYLSKSFLSRDSQAKYVSTAISWWIFFTLGLFCFSLILPGWITRVILGKGFEFLTWPVLLGFSGLYLYTILYGTYRGEQSFLRANIYQLIFAGLTPLIALYFSYGIVERFFLIYSSFMFISNFFVLIDLYFRKLLLFPTIGDLTNISKIFFKFGFPRIPGEFSLFGLMSAPLFFIAKYESLEIAGYLAVGFTLVQLVSSLFEFIGTLMLSKSAQLISEGEFLKLNHLVRLQTKYSFLASIFISSIIYLNIDYLLFFLDNNSFVQHIDYIKMVIFCIPFYIIYLLIRNPQDALSIKPFNTYNLVVCFFVQVLFLLLTFMFTSHEFKFLLYHLSVIIPFVLLGILSFFSWNFQIKKYLE